MKNIIKYIIICLILFQPSLAEVTINNSQQYFIIENVTFNFSSNQTYESISLYQNQIVINGYALQIIPTSSINLTINNYDTTNNNYNITFAGNDNNINFAQSVSQAGKYRFLVDGLFFSDIITTGNVLYATINLAGRSIFVWSLIPNSYISVQCLTTSDGIYSMTTQSFTIISIALMVFGFSFVIIGLRGKNAKLIISGILTTTVGFSMVTIGLYLVTSIASVTVTNC